MRTIVLKLHNPSKRKRDIMDEAMMAYSLAYQYLLDKAKGEVGEIRKKFCKADGSCSAKKLEKWVKDDISKELNIFGIECFKDSLKMDFAMTLASYFQLKEVRNEAGYPVAYLTEEKWLRACDHMLGRLADGSMRIKEYEKEFKKLGSKAVSPKPIFFCRYALNRDFCLLYDEEKNRYFAKLYLMNVKSSKRAKIESGKARTLKYVSKEMQLFEDSHKKERFILVPLSFGQWQEGFLRKALSSPDILKTARLSKKGDQYYLSVNIQIEDEEKVKTKAFMGVSRGIKHGINYTIIDEHGVTASKGFADLDCRAKADLVKSDQVHKLANAIVEKALQHKAQVITQPLTSMGDKLKYVQEDGTVNAPVLNCNQYNTLNSILKYKLKGKGLPPPIETSPVGVFHTCPLCGLNALQNRFSRDMLICIACGTAMDIESVGSLNLAKRLIKYNSTVIEVKVEKGLKGLRFINKDLGLDYIAEDSGNFLEEFKAEVYRLIRDFYDNISTRKKDKGFKRIFSMIKRIESAKDFTKLLKVIE